MYLRALWTVFGVSEQTLSCLCWENREPPNEFPILIKRGHLQCLRPHDANMLYTHTKEHIFSYLYAYKNVEIKHGTNTKLLANQMKACNRNLVIHQDICWEVGKVGNQLDHLPFFYTKFSSDINHTVLFPLKSKKTSTWLTINQSKSQEHRWCIQHP